jgi:hypothetical protein
LVVLAEANGCDSFGLGIPEKPEVLLHACPIPPTVGDVIEFCFFNLVD